MSAPERGADARVAAIRHILTDPVERELAEGRGVDLNVVVGLLAAYDEVGRCGGVMPRLFDGAPMFCRLPHGHAGWHKCDDGTEWGARESVMSVPESEPAARGGLSVEHAYQPSWDRIYPRCPVCRREQYGPAVIGFSQGDYGCHACGHVVREDARLARTDDEDPIPEETK